MTADRSSTLRRGARLLLAAAVAAASLLPPLLAASAPSTAYASGVGYAWWTTGPQDKVFRTTTPPNSARTVGHPSAPPISIGAAQAEYEGVQVVVRPYGDAVTDLWLEPSDLVRAQGGASTIPSEEVETFKVHYVDITQPSYGQSRKGLFPDALIPMTLANGQRLGWQPSGAPEDPSFRTVAEDTTQPFYVLFRVPDGTQPGTYWGDITVTGRGVGGDPIPVQRIPVLLEVFDFSIARKTLRTSVGINMQLAMFSNSASERWLGRDPSPPPDSDRVAESTDYYVDQLTGWLRFLAEHRLSPQMMLPAWETGSDWAPPADNGDMIARDDVLADYLSSGPPTVIGGERLDFYSVKMPEYGAPSWVRDPFASQSNRTRAAQYWSTMRDELAPWLSKTYAYPIDEPSRSQRGFVEQYADFVHANAPGVPFMVTTDPVTMEYRLLSDVDIYAHKLHFFYRDMERWIEPIRRSGGKVWIYSHATTHQKDVPMFLVDKPFAESRAQGWFAYHTRADGWLYFNIAAWRYHDGSRRDPYVDALSYSTTYQGGPMNANGDGSLAYPGYYPAEGLVIQGSPPVSSLRMEALRDGLEDYEYLKLLEARNGRATADAQVARLIGAPAGVPAGGVPTFPAYSKDHESYETVRDDIAALLGAPVPDWDGRPPYAAKAEPVTPDAWEGGAGDDTWGDATDITDLITNMPYGDVSMDPLAQVRTIDTANGTLGDEDWLRFTISAEQVDWGMDLRFEALTAEGDLDTVIELYGPGAPSPTAPASLPEGTARRTALDPNAVAGGDDSVWFAGRQASAHLSIPPGTPGAAGTYYVRVRPYYQGDFGQADPPEGYGDAPGGYTLRVRNGNVQRLSGSDRFLTAVEISRERYADGDLAGGAVLVATGMAFPDALSGSTLAGAVDGPVLLTPPTRLHGGVAAEIERLGASTVYVLGGPSSVSGPVLSAIDSIPGVGTVRRLHGPDRFATTLDVARTADALIKAGGDPEGVAGVAFVVNGLNFPDALAASPMAAWNRAPILLTLPDRLHPTVRAAISDLGITDVVIVGGPPAVSDGVRAALETELGGADHVRRISGASRYDTARALAAWATELDSVVKDGAVGTAADPAGLRTLPVTDGAGFASAANYPDALAGGVMSGLAGAPVVLVHPDEVPRSVWRDYFGAYIAPEHGILGKSYLFGGPPAVSDRAYFQLDALSDWIGVQPTP